MNRFIPQKVERIFSIPGRIRIKVSGLYKNSSFVTAIEMKLMNIDGILSVHPNAHSGNVIIEYKIGLFDEAGILRLMENTEFLLDDFNCLKKKKICLPLSILTSAFNPLTLIRLKKFKMIYSSENRIAKGLILSGIIIGSIVFGLSGNIGALFSILILSHPGILYWISNNSYSYVSKQLLLSSVFIKNFTSVKLIQNAQTVFIDCSAVLIPDINSYQALNKLNRNEIERFIYENKTIDPVEKNIKKLINGLRSFGKNDISILSRHRGKILEYASYKLGVNVMYYMQNYIYENKLNTTDIIVITTDSSTENLFSNNHPITACLYRHEFPEVLKSDINLYFKNIDGLLKLIKESMNSEEYIIRSHSTAVAINMIGIFFAAFGYIGSLGALSLYGLNMLSHVLLFKKIFYKGGRS